MNKKNFNYNYQYQKWHNDTEESIKYDIEENLKLLETHNIYPNKKEAKILELGCATGCFMQTLLQKGFHNIKGIDIDEHLTSIAKNKKLNVQTCDAVDFLSQNTEKYDVIYCLDLLEHIDKNEQIKFLTMIESHLTDSGFCVLKVPNALTPLESYFRYDDFTHNISYTTNSLNFLLLNANFKYFTFRAQHLEDEELRLAKHNYAYMLYKQFGISSPILTPNIVAIAFKNDSAYKKYEADTPLIINNYFEKEKTSNNIEPLIFFIIAKNYKIYKCKYKLFDFINFITFNKIPNLVKKKKQYKSLYRLAESHKTDIEHNFKKIRDKEHFDVSEF